MSRNIKERKLIRRTRQQRIYEYPDGSREVEPNLAVTQYSFVLSQAIEYKKKRAVVPRKYTFVIFY